MARDCYEFDYDMYMGLRGYAVYEWIRNGRPLYIGRSELGINRPTDRSHHVIHHRDAFRPGDILRVYPMPDEKTMKRTEREWIQRKSPDYNVEFNDHEGAYNLFECDKCRHNFIRNQIGPNHCNGRCKGDFDCPCRVARREEEDKLEYSKSGNRPTIVRCEDKKPNGCGSLVC